MWWPQTALQAISAWLHQASDFTDALWRLQDPPRPLQRCLGRHRPCGFLAQPPFAGAHVQFVPSRLAERSRYWWTKCDNYARQKSVPKYSFSKYAFWASGVRTTASTDRAEKGHITRSLSSVPKCPIQEVRRGLASGEGFSAASALGRSTGLPRKP